MPHVELDVETSLSPERVREALLDFSERRPDLWPDLDRGQYEVYEVADTSAHVKEGSRLPGKTIWAKERYDWSEPNTVRWIVTESNFCAPGSFVAATIMPREGGGSRVHVEWQRTGTTLSGRLLIRLIAATKGKPIRASLRKSFGRLEQATAGEAGSAA
jgi:hypothetical protein